MPILPAVVVLIDRTGHIQDANAAASEILGLPIERLRGLSVLDAVWSTRTPDGREFSQGERLVPRVLRSGQAIHGAMTRVQRPDGTVRWLEVHIVPEFDATGAIDQLVVSYIDLTPRVLAEDAQRQSVAYLRRLLQVAPVGACVTDEHAVFEYVNDAYAAMLGYSRGELEGQSTLSVVPPEDRARAAALFAQRMASGLTTQSELRLLTRTGEVKTALGGTVHIVGLDGRPRLASFVLDITDRGRMEEALRESEERFRTAMIYAPIGKALVGLDGRFLAVNAALCEIVGYSEEELLTRTFQDITHPDDLDADLANAHLLREGALRSYQMEKRYFHKQGHVVWILLSGSLVRGQDGAPLYFIAQIQDITERKRIETALAQRTHELERSNADLNRFASVAAHDLRAPLTTLMGFAELLQIRYAAALGDKGTHYLDAVLKSSARMLHLIDDLLAYARLDSRSIPATPVACSALLAEVLLDCSAALQETGGSVTPSLLPAITGDPTQIRQLFQNLIGNALKFHRPGVAPVVQVTAEQHGTDWLFRITDNGIGIAPADVEHVFGMFQRVHNHGEYEGTGIGLAICKKIVERHGGRIWIESQPGNGATVLFTWPANVRADPPSSPAWLFG